MSSDDQKFFPLFTMDSCTCGHGADQHAERTGMCGHVFAGTDVSCNCLSFVEIVRDTWAIEALCKKMEDERESRPLAVSVPPRHAMSLCILPPHALEYIPTIENIRLRILDDISHIRVDHRIVNRTHHTNAMIDWDELHRTPRLGLLLDSASYVCEPPVRPLGSWGLRGLLWRSTIRHLGQRKVKSPPDYEDATAEPPGRPWVPRRHQRSGHQSRRPR